MTLTIRVPEDQFSITDANGQPDNALTFAVDAQARIAARRKLMTTFPSLALVLDTTELSIDAGLLSGHTMAWWPQVGGTSISGLNVLGPSPTGTATARVVGTSGPLGATPKTGYVSAAGAGSLAGFRHSSSVLIHGSFSGFLSVLRFAVTDTATVAGARMFAGLQSSTSAPTNVDPASLTNALGIAQLDSDATQLYLVAAGGSAQTPLALGTTFPPQLSASSSAGPGYELSVLSLRSQELHWSLRRMDTGDATGGQVTGGNRFADNTLVAVNSWRCNNATALACAIDLMGWYGTVTK